MKKTRGRGDTETRRGIIPASPRHRVPASPVKLLILGLGNLLCGDDGVGIRAVEMLRAQYEWPEGVEVLDGGTLGLSLLPYLQDAQAAILVDAIRTGEAPGTLRRLQQDEVLPVVLERLSPHQIGVADLLGAAGLLGQIPEPLILLGVVAEKIELRWGLSATAEAALPGLVDGIVSEARRLGWDLKPRLRTA